MDAFSIICIILIAVAVGLYLPPVALAILVIASPVITIYPAIIYMFVISGVYAIKNMDIKKVSSWVEKYSEKKR